MVAPRGRDLAGAAAFELALQYMLIRQDRSYHFVQLLTALFFVVVVAELALLLLTSLLLLLLPLVPLLSGVATRLEQYTSPTLTTTALVALLLLRASKKRFVIEPGEQTLERLNRDVLEPCLGMKFAVDDGRLYADTRYTTTTSTEGFYAMHYDTTTTTTAAARSESDMV